MFYIRRLPFILGSSLTIIVGLVNYGDGILNKEIYTKMIISMLLFTSMGFYIRNLIIKLTDEIEKKKEEERKQEILKQKEEMEEQEKFQDKKEKEEKKEEEDMLPLDLLIHNKGEST